MDGIEKFVIATIISAVVVFVTVVGALGIHDWSKHRHETCTSSHQEYVPPTYVKSGNVLVPVGGGMENVCDHWVKKGAS